MTKILVVDDDEEILKLFNIFLDQVPEYSVDLASSGEQAFAVAEKTSYDLIITDLLMDAMSGLDLIKKLRVLTAYKKTPMLVVSSDHSKDSIMAGKAMGISGWVVKPIKNETLLPLVEKVLQKAS